MYVNGDFSFLLFRMSSNVRMTGVWFKSEAALVMRWYPQFISLLISDNHGWISRRIASRTAASEHHAELTPLLMTEEHLVTRVTCDLTSVTYFYKNNAMQSNFNLSRGGEWKLFQVYWLIGNTLWQMRLAYGCRPCHVFSMLRLRWSVYFTQIMDISTGSLQPQYRGLVDN